MALTKRVEVLFDLEAYRVIEELAKRSGEAIGSIVRKAVEERYLKADVERRREAVRRFLSLPSSDFTWEETKEIIETDAGRRL